MNRSGRINWNFLIVCFLGVVAVAVTVTGLWYWNKQLRADRGLRLGQEAYEAEQWDRAADFLGQYLAAIMPDQDVEMLLKYADAQLNRRPLKKEHVEQALRSYHQVLRIEENEQARKRLIELYLSGDPLEAERNAEAYLKNKFDPQIVCFAARAQMQQHQTQQAVSRLKTLIEQEPDFLQAYLLLAQAAEKSPETSEKTPLEWLTRAVEAAPDNPLAYLYRARYAIQNQQPQIAQSDSQRALSLGLTTREQKTQFASVCLLSNRMEEARTWLEALAEEDAGDLLLWTLWAQWALQSGSEEEMAWVAEKGLAAMGPDPYDFLSVAAELYIQAGRWQQARQCIQTLADRQERQEVLTYLEGLLAEAQGHWPDAIAAWRKVAASPNQNFNIQIKLAQALERMGDRMAAIQQIRSLLMRQPDLQQGHSLLARWSAEAGRWAEAMDHARQALRLRPDDPAMQKLLLEIKMQQAQSAQISPEDEEWLSLMGRLRDLHPEDPSIQALQIQAAIRQGQVEQAAQQLTQLEQQKADPLQTRLLRADLLAALGQTQQAAEVLDQAIQEAPNSLEPVKKRILLDVQNQQIQPCLNRLEQWIEQADIPQTQKTLRLWKAELYVLAEQKEAAIEELTALAREEPQDIPVRRRLLELTRKTESQRKLQEWIEEIRTLEGQQGRQWRYEQARLLYERGDMSREYPQVISLLEGILRDYPEDLASRILLASSHEAAGNLRLAIAEYQDALARDPENMDLVVSAVGAMYRAEEYRQAENVIELVSRRGLRDPRLSRLEARHLLRQGKLGSASEILREMMAQSPEDQNLKLSLALIRLYQDHLDEAEQLIDQLLADNPESMPAIAAKVELAIRRKQPELAIRICDQAVSRFEDPKLYTLRAMTRIKLRDPQGAQADLNQMLERTDRSQDHLLLAGDLYLYMGRPDLAGQIMEEALAANPDDFVVLKKAAVIFSRDPKNTKTAAVLEKALAEQPRDPELRLLKAQSLLRENTSASTEQAEDLLASLVAEYPRMETAWVLLGDWSYRKGQAGRAMDYVLQGLGYFPDSKALILLKAQIESIRSRNLAIPTLEDLHQRYPEDDRIAAILGETYLHTGQADAAADFLSQAIQRRGQEASIPLQQVYMMALYQKGQKEQARQLYETLDGQGRDSAGTLQRWAGLLIRDQQWASLETLFQQKGIDSPQQMPVLADLCLQLGMDEDTKARQTARNGLLFLLEKYPDHPHLNVSLGRLEHYQQSYQAAERRYRKALHSTAEPAAEDSLRVIAMNNLAWIVAHENKNTEEALQWANRGLNIQPENSDLLDTRGEIYLLAERYEKAKEDFEKAMTLYPPNSSNRIGTGFRLAKTLLRLGKNTEAVKLFDQVQKWNLQQPVLSSEQLIELNKYVRD